jgi:hypothetical protein
MPEALAFLLGATLLLYFGSANLRVFISGKPALKISALGIEENQFGFGEIPWEEIVGAEAVVKISSGTTFRTIYIQVQNIDKYRARLSMWRRVSLRLYTKRQNVVPLDVTYLDGNLQEAKELIERYRPNLPVAGSTS